MYFRSFPMAVPKIRAGAIDDPTGEYVTAGAYDGVLADYEREKAKSADLAQRAGALERALETQRRVRVLGSAPAPGAPAHPAANEGSRVSELEKQVKDLSGNVQDLQGKLNWQAGQTRAAQAQVAALSKELADARASSGA
jgi:hypothetical protein